MACTPNIASRNSPMNRLDRALRAACAALDPEIPWADDRSAFYTQTGATQPLPNDHFFAARAATHPRTRAHLPRLNRRHDTAGDRQTCI